MANADGVVSFPYRPGQTAVDGTGAKVFDLPGPPINHHWTKNVVASPDGSRLYATVGSNSNIGDNGMAAEEGRAAIWVYDIAARRKPGSTPAACATRTASTSSRTRARSGPS